MTSLVQRDLDRMSPQARETWEMLAALREGRVLAQLADMVVDVVNAVIDHVSVNEAGKVTGPTGSVNLTLTIGPSQQDPEGTVDFTDKLTMKKPEDRTHTLYVGRGGTVHARNPHDRLRPQLELIPTAEVAPSAPQDRPPAASAGASAGAAAVRDPFTRLPADDTPDTPGDQGGDGDEGPDQRTPYKD